MIFCKDYLLSHENGDVDEKINSVNLYTNRSMDHM